MLIPIIVSSDIVPHDDAIGMSCGISLKVETAFLGCQGDGAFSFVIRSVCPYLAFVSVYSYM